MKRAGCIALFLVLALLSAVSCTAAENEGASSIRDLVITERNRSLSGTAYPGE